MIRKDVSYVFPDKGLFLRQSCSVHGYAGFLYLGGIYGLKMEVPVETDDAKENAVEEAATSTEETVTSTEEAVTVTDTVTQ